MRIKNKLHSAKKRMVLDFSGVMPVSDQPKKVSELNSTYNLFKETQPERFKSAYDVIVNREIPSGDNTAIIASKVIEIIEKNIDIMESHSINEITDSTTNILKSIDDSVEKIIKTEVEKYKKDFVVKKIKIGKENPIKIKGVQCRQFEDILQLATARMNIMMVGPSGSGKTHIAGQVAQALKLDFASQSCSAGMSESQLTGWLLPIKNGNFEYVPSEFIRLYENGGVFLLDEMDAADPNVLIFINQALANNSFSLAQRFKNPLIKRHKDFVAISACNTYGSGADAMYHARNALDASTIDRFKMGMILIDYDEKVEKELVDSEILSWGIVIREIISKHGIRKIMSTRFLRDATKMKEHGWNKEMILNSYFLDWSEEEKLIANKRMEHAEFKRKWSDD